MSDTRALRQAVAKNNATKVRSLLSQGGATVDAEVLLLAATRGHAAVLRMLLEAGAALSASEAPGLLIAAVQSPDGTATLSHLLQAIPADGLNGTVREWTPLMHAVKLGLLGAVDALLQAGANADYRMPTAGGTALMIGVQHAQPEAVARLLGAKAAVETQDAQGWTALKWAAQMGDVAVVRALLDAGATVEAAEGEGSALMVAAENLRAEAVEELVARGSPLEARDAQGWNAVAVAAAAGHVRILLSLFRGGASLLGRTGKTERTALMAAAQGGHTPAVQLLVRQAEKLAAEDPARLAASKGGAHAAENGAAPGERTGWLPPVDLVAAGGRVHAQALDMEAMARQSLGFADATQHVSVEGLRQQIQQLQLRLVAEQQCVLREQHITARMWIEKSEAEERADGLQEKCEQLQQQVASWEAWQLSQRKQQRQRRQQALQQWADDPDELLRHLLAGAAGWRDGGAASAQALPAEQRRQLGRTLVAAANLLHLSSPNKPPGL